MKHEILPGLLKKYLRGETTPEESVLLAEWYSSLQENPDDISLLDPLELDIVESRILKKIKRNISHQIRSEIKHSRTSSKFYFLRTPFKLAAAIAAIAVIGLGAILFKEKGLPSLQNQTVAKTSTIKKLSNETSEVKKVQLEAGTIINIQPNSSVEYPERFRS